jgi:hypothetical protein
MRWLLAITCTLVSATLGGCFGEGNEPGAGLQADVPPVLAARADTVLDISAQLAGLDGITVEELPSGAPGYRFFQMWFRQPTDHADPQGPHFFQRVSLMHRSVEAPTVLDTSGYHLEPGPFRAELTRLLGANQVAVEHRFFGPSRPDPTNWHWLTIFQAANDHHRLVAALSAIYPGVWIGSGRSKGGMAAVYHRRFFPDDVVATVAYAAPHNLGPDDPRYPYFLRRVGSSACRQRVRDLQGEMLSRRWQLMPLVRAYVAEQGIHFRRLGLDTAFETAVCEAQFSFWQWHSSQCGLLPGPGASPSELWQLLNRISPIAAGSDEMLASMEAHYYQAATQLGYPRTDVAHIRQWLWHSGIRVVRAYMPGGESARFGDDAMADIGQWLRAEGVGMLFLYGANDPWTAGQFDLGSAADSYKFIVPGADHGVRLTDLRGPDRAAVVEALERWTAVAPDFSAIDDEPEHRRGDLVRSGIYR